MHSLGPGQGLDVDGSDGQIQDGGPGDVRGKALGLGHEHAPHPVVVPGADGLAVADDKAAGLGVAAIITGVEDHRRP